MTPGSACILRQWSQPGSNRRPPACKATAPSPGAAPQASVHGHPAPDRADASSAESGAVQRVRPNDWPNGLDECTRCGQIEPAELDPPCTYAGCPHAAADPFVTSEVRSAFDRARSRTEAHAEQALPLFAGTRSNATEPHRAQPRGRGADALDRQIARAVLSFAPAGGIVHVSDPDAFWRGLRSLLKIAARRHRRLWAADDDLARAPLPELHQGAGHATAGARPTPDREERACPR